MIMRNKKVKNWKFFDNYSWYVPGVKEMFVLIAMLLLGALLGNLVTGGFALMTSMEASSEYAMILAYPVMFLPAMIYANARSRSRSYADEGLKLDNAHYSPVGGALCAVFAAVSTLALAFCSDFFGSLLPDMPEWLEDMLKNMTQGNIFVNFLCVSIFAPFFEEWLCRGMVLRGLLGRGLKPVWAIVISAVFFALIHANPWQAVPAFLLGCLFGYFYYKTGSLKLTMLMHFTNNTFSLILSNVSSLEATDSWMDVFPGAEYWLIFAACILMLALIVLRLRRIPVEANCNCDRVPSLFGETEA